MHFVILGVHPPDICPTSNSKTKALILEMAPQIPKIAESHGVKIVAGPYVNHEHTTVLIVETDRADDLDAFLEQSRLPQWNQIRILPSRPMEDGIRQVKEGVSLF